MKRILNTLYVTTEDTYLYRKGDTVTVSVKDKDKLRIPLHSLEGIYCFGNTICTTPLIEGCNEFGVKIVFYTKTGRFIARIQGPIYGNVLLRKEQYTCSNNEIKANEIAKFFLAAKLANSRSVLLRAYRESKIQDRKILLKNAALQIEEMGKKISDEVDYYSLLGYEGRAANVYFSVLNNMIYDNNGFLFNGRNKRPPKDPVNAMLSFIYAVLCNDIISALEGVGLDPAVGYLHKERSGKPSLALDIMEEFRAYLADRLILSLINKKQVKKSDFSTFEGGSVDMQERAKKIIITAWQKRKQEEITHPFLKEKVHIGMLPHIQAMLFSRFIRGDIKQYPPFYMK